MSLKKSLQLIQDGNDCHDGESIDLELNKPLAKDISKKWDHKQQSISETNIIKSTLNRGDNADGKAMDNEPDNQDIEEGQVTGLSDSDFLNQYSCRFYQKGFCVYGRYCRFFHLSDKGLYSMFDSPDVRLNVVQYQTECNPHNAQLVSVPESQSSWDRALVDATILMKQRKATKREECLEKNKLHLPVENNCAVKEFTSHGDKSTVGTRELTKHSKMKENEGFEQNKPCLTADSSKMAEWSERRELKRKRVPSSRRHSCFLSPFHASKSSSCQREVISRKKSRSWFLSCLQPSQTHMSTDGRPLTTSDRVRSRIRSPIPAYGLNAKSDSINLSSNDVIILSPGDLSPEATDCAIKSPCIYLKGVNSTSRASLNGIVPTPERRRFRGNRDVSSDTSVVPNKYHSKKLDALEMELYRYHRKAGLSPPPTDAKQNRLKIEEISGSVKKHKNINSLHCKDERPLKDSSSSTCHLSTQSKRDLLLKQLRCIEESIARKQNSMMEQTQHKILNSLHCKDERLLKDSSSSTRHLSTQSKRDLLLKLLRCIEEAIARKQNSMME